MAAPECQPEDLQRVGFELLNVLGFFGRNNENCMRQTRARVFFLAWKQVRDILPCLVERSKNNTQTFCRQRTAFE